MEAIKFYIEAYVNSSIYGRTFNECSYRKDCERELEYQLLKRIKEINGDFDISVSLSFDKDKENKVWPTISRIIVGDVANKLWFQKGKYKIQGKINNIDEYKRKISETGKYLEEETGKIYETYNLSGELLLLSRDYYDCCHNYFSSFFLEEKTLRKHERKLKSIINDMLYSMNIVGKYNLPIVRDYKCEYDELPPIEFISINGMPVKLYSVMYDLERKISEFAITCSESDKNKVYFVTMMINIMEQAKLNWRRK